MPLLMLLVFALTLFTSATLLFLVQPMVGKAILPLLGGTPAVWNTCMVFFQALLLAGYAYAHFLTQRLRLRTQVLVHAGVLLLPLIPLIFLRFDARALAESWLPPGGEANPIPWLLAVLGLVAGVPFFVVSTSAPLLQKWFAGTDHPAAKDPYFLYGASNLGSMLALLAYPTIVEPTIGLGRQAWLWTGAYLALAALTLLCGLVAGASRARAAASSPGQEPAVNGTASSNGHEPAANGAGPSLVRWVRWVLLAAVPSSLMLGVTTHLTTDIAAVPLLWILPLAVYLLTFILVFSRLPSWLYATLVILGPVLLLACYLAPSGSALGNTPIWTAEFWEALKVPARELLAQSTPLKLSEILLLQLAAVFVVIFGSSPERLHLGMVLTAPFAFVAVAMVPDVRDFLGLKEFEIILLHLVVLFVAAMVCHGELARTRPTPKYLTGFYLAMAFGGVLGGTFNAFVAPFAFNKVVEYPMMLGAVCLLAPHWYVSPGRSWSKGLAAGYATLMVCFGIGVAGFLLGRAYLSPELAERFPEALRPRARQFAAKFGPDLSRTIYQGRNFFGSFTVAEYDTRHSMYHGTTTHGVQDLHKDRRREPLSYFHRTGPIGQLFEAVDARDKPMKVAVLGLGTGTLAAYMKPGWELTLFEIDAAVVKVARNDRYFTFINDCEKRGVKVTIVMGDGRLQIAKQPADTFDLLFMDAFTSDAVPVHLITMEAIAMYFTKLKPDGLLIVNIANRYLTFEPVLGNLAEELGLKALLQQGDEDRSIDRYASAWVVMARQTSAFGILPDLHYLDYHWMELTPNPKLGVWRDDYSNLLGIFRWNR